MALGKRELLEKTLQVLVTERQSWEPAWREIAEQMIPYRISWDTEKKRNRGERKDHAIVNNTPVQAIRTLAAGMMAGVTSPARPWFKLDTLNKELAEVPAVKLYLDQSTDIISAALKRSNFYSVLANSTYRDLGGIGTSAIFFDEPEPGEYYFNDLPPGQYYLDTNHKGEVDTCYRRMVYTVRQMVRQFGEAALSVNAREQWRRGDINSEHDIVHAVYPNDEYDHGRAGPAGMRWSSVWWDAATPRGFPFLREAGFIEFPVLAPRWTVSPGDTYGRGPGWEARGDCRTLQYYEKIGMKVSDKIVDPPMKASPNIDRASLLPGDVTVLPDGEGSIYEPAIKIDPKAMDVNELRVLRTEQRINKTMYVDLFLAIINDTRRQPRTAREIQELTEERMLMIGPVLENLDNDLLDPCISRAYRVAERSGLLPDPPPELEGQDLQPRYISILHQQQQQTGLAGIRTVIGVTADLASFRPDAVDKLDVDVIIDEVARMAGTRPDIIVPQEEVDKLRAQQAKQAEAQQTGEAMLTATEGAKNLGGADPEKIAQMSSMIAPQGGGA